LLKKIMDVGGNKSIITAAGATWASVTKDDLLKVKAKLQSAVILNGDVAWYCCHEAKTAVFERIALEAGGALAAEVVAGTNATYLGYPIRVMEAFPAEEAAGKPALVFGSMKKGVLFGNRRELTITTSAEAGFLTDSEMIRATERFDIATHEEGTNQKSGAFMLLKFA
jgi:HK97 family phage major capsid protein